VFGLEALAGVLLKWGGETLVKLASEMVRQYLARRDIQDAERGRLLLELAGQEQAQRERVLAFLARAVADPGGAAVLRADDPGAAPVVGFDPDRPAPGARDAGDVPPR